MTPAGNFIAKNHNANLVGIAAGSGITPIFSLLKSVLNAGGKFTLYYGNVNVTFINIRIDPGNITKATNFYVNTLTF